MRWLMALSGLAFSCVVWAFVPVTLDASVRQSLATDVPCSVENLSLL